MQVFFLFVQLFIINLLLSIDNSVLIAATVKDLPDKKRKTSQFFGGFLSVFLKFVLVFLLLFLLESFEIPFIYVIGGVFLIVVGLLLTNNKNKEAKSSGSYGMLKAIGIIVLTDLMMSFDNSIIIVDNVQRMGIDIIWQVVVVVIILFSTLPIVLFFSEYLSKFMKENDWVIYVAAILIVAAGVEMIFDDPLVIVRMNSFAILTLSYSLATIGVFTKILISNFEWKEEKNDSKSIWGVVVILLFLLISENILLLIWFGMSMKSLFVSNVYSVNIILGLVVPVIVLIFYIIYGYSYLLNTYYIVSNNDKGMCTKEFALLSIIFAFGIGGLILGITNYYENRDDIQEDDKKNDEPNKKIEDSVDDKEVENNNIKTEEVEQLNNK